MSKPVVAVVFGTRPEAVKLAPVIQALRKQDSVQSAVITTGQHREMLAQILNGFQIPVDHEMDLMEPDQSLFQLSARAIIALEKAIEKFKPSFLLVQGDTTTAFLGALCAFYGKVPVGHVEAGLRTDNKYFPFPEEVNRRLVSACADLHFAPTERNRENLLRENVPAAQIFVTGNTVIDALLQAAQSQWVFPLPKVDLRGKKLILVTVHRRESFGKPMEEMFAALRDLAGRNSDVEVVYPVHLNPKVRGPAFSILGNVPNVHLIDPVDYFDFVQIMKKAYLILTDSGGIQEEAPSLGVPVLVLRNETERPEAINAGTVLLAGTDREKIIRQTQQLLDDPKMRSEMSQSKNPYGDGHASERIVGHVLEYLRKK